jgi:hypothetical protein
MTPWTQSLPLLEFPSSKQGIASSPEGSSTQCGKGLTQETQYKSVFRQQDTQNNRGQENPFLLRMLKNGRIQGARNPEE